MKDNPKDENKTISTDELMNAVKNVQAAIKAKEDQYREIASTEEQDPVLLEGMTVKGYGCHVLVDPKDVAQLFLEYNYPVWSVLEEEPPIGLWDDLARFYGLESVSSVDL